MINHQTDLPNALINPFQKIFKKVVAHVVKHVAGEVLLIAVQDDSFHFDRVRNLSLS